MYMTCAGQKPRAVWDGLVDEADLKVAWKQAMIQVGLAERPFQAVRGPAGAMVASARKLGWSVPSPFDFIDGSGVHLSLRTTCPMVLVQHSKDDLMRSEAAASSLAQRLAGHQTWNRCATC